MFPFTKYSYTISPYTHDVTAHSSYAGKTVKASAHCADEDEWNPEIGCTIAAARCEVKVSEKRLKRAINKLKSLEKFSEWLKKEMDSANSYLSDSYKNYEDALKNLESVQSGEINYFDRLTDEDYAFYDVYRDEKFLKTVCIFTKGKSEEDILNEISAHALSLGCPDDYYRLIGDSKNVVTVDYGSWSHFLYFKNQRAQKKEN